MTKIIGAKRTVFKNYTEKIIHRASFSHVTFQNVTSLIILFCRKNKTCAKISKKLLKNMTQYLFLKVV